MDLTALLLLAGMVVLTAFSAFFSGSETALFALEHAERSALRRQQPRVAAVVDRLCADPRGLLTTLLLGNVIVNTLYFSMGAVLALRLSGEVAAPGGHHTVEGAIGLMQVLWLVALGEVLPKTTAASLRMKCAPLVAPPLATLVRASAPLRDRLIAWVIDPVARLAGAPAEQNSAHASGLTRADLVEAIAVGEERGAITLDEEQLLRRLVVHRRLRVRDVMTPRTEVAWVSLDGTAEDVRRAASRGRVRRLVVCGDDLDDIRGVLDVRACLIAGGSVKDQCAPATFIPELASLAQLEASLQRAATDLAIAVDEFGGTAGVVAVEDSLEQLVGDIVSSGEALPTAPARSSDGALVFDGRTTVAECVQELEAELPRMHASTVAGLAAEVLGRMPREGDHFTLGEFEWRVLSLRQGRAGAIAVRRTAETGGSADGREEEESP